MKIKANKKFRNIDFRYLAELKSYRGLSKEELDTAINGVLFRGRRYPLHYVFWQEWKFRKVTITLTNEVGTLIGESIITSQSCHFESSTRGIVLLPDGRITDIAYSMIHFI